MNISLAHVLKRNKSNLKTFIEKNKLTTYERLLEYCESRRFIPCTEEEYNKVVEKEPVHDGRKEVVGEASKAQEPKKRRYRRKKQQDAPKLPDSTDKR